MKNNKIKKSIKIFPISISVDININNINDSYKNSNNIKNKKNQIKNRTKIKAFKLTKTNNKKKNNKDYNKDNNKDNNNKIQIRKKEKKVLNILIHSLQMIIQ